MLLEPDFDSMLQLCDMIRSGDIKAREAVALMKTRVMEDKNPHVQFFSLCVSVFFLTLYHMLYIYRNHVSKLFRL